MPGQFNNNMYLNPQMGMKPAPVQGGGMQQGMPMGGQGQPMPGEPQPMPNPPAQGGQNNDDIQTQRLMALFSGGGMQQQNQFAQLQNQFPNPAAQYQSQIDDIMGQIQRAQFNGANPMMIADLQMQLQQLQRQQQESHALQMADMMRNKPVGSPRIGGGTSFNPQEQQNYQADMWLLQQLMSGGGGGYGPQIG